MSKAYAFYLGAICLTLFLGSCLVMADEHDAPEIGAAVAEGHEHEHTAASAGTVVELDDGTGFTLWRLTSWLGNFHPVSVHFPIALLLAACLAELIAVLTGTQRYASAGRYCLVLGALSAILAGALGWCMGGFRWSDGDWLLLTGHRWLGTFTALLSVILLALCPRSARKNAKVSRRLYRATMLVAAGLVAVTGYLGGVMVWGADHLSW